MTCIKSRGSPGCPQPGRGQYDTGRNKCAGDSAGIGHSFLAVVH
ncbi:MAG TPA: hypothetical protein VN621_09535 [Arthrobacter sp.]|nr:hypothetical protein [Arthrobacter sp.]